MGKKKEQTCLSIKNPLIFFVLGLLTFFLISKIGPFLINKNKESKESPKESSLTKYPFNDEASYYSTGNADFKTTANPRFNFWFDIPNSWQAFARSQNGDGYSIETGDKNVDLRIYGGWKVFSDDETYEMIMENDGKMSDFEFRDGIKGKHFIKNDSQSFMRNEENRRITLYIETKDKKWLEENMEKILYIARSIRPGKG